jgi:hypothetical protein
MYKVVFKGNTYDVEFGRYQNNRVAIELVDPITGECGAVATVNIPEADLPPGEVFIKTWSENEGILTALADAGIVKKTGKAIPIGWVYADIAVLLVPDIDTIAPKRE